MVWAAGDCGGDSVGESGGVSDAELVFLDSGVREGVSGESGGRGLESELERSRFLSSFGMCGGGEIK